LHAVSPFRQVDEARPATRDMLILLYQPLRESPQSADLLKQFLCPFEFAA